MVADSFRILANGAKLQNNAKSVTVFPINFPKFAGGESGDQFAIRAIDLAAHSLVAKQSPFKRSILVRFQVGGNVAKRNFRPERANDLARVSGRKGCWTPVKRDTTTRDGSRDSCWAELKFQVVDCFTAANRMPRSRRRKKEARARLQIGKRRR